MGSSRTSTFVAIYRGRTASDARLVAVSADPAIVATVVGQILAEHNPGPPEDPVVEGIDRARRQGLRLIQREFRLLTEERRDREPRP
jgi:hypothetical protein